MKYTLEELVKMIDPRNGVRCLSLWEDNKERFQVAWGSSHNHQAWPGGYIDHITAVMNIAVVLHESLSTLGPLPFEVSDALLVLFLHDLEKPWRFSSAGTEQVLLNSKAEKAAFRISKIYEYNIWLSVEHLNALKYVEGENDDYSSKQRTMNELAAFCHMCDVASARIWYW